jgi:hypothetical protein
MNEAIASMRRGHKTQIPRFGQSGFCPTSFKSAIVADGVEFADMNGGGPGVLAWKKKAESPPEALFANRTQISRVISMWALPTRPRNSPYLPSRRCTRSVYLRKRAAQD